MVEAGAGPALDRRGVIAGTLPVVATPFTEGGAAVDRKSLRRLVDYAAAAGADGLVYPGVASEFDRLSVAERSSALETVVDAAAGRLPVIAGASSDDPRAAAQLVRRGRQIGAAAAMVMAPRALRGAADRLIDFFTLIAAERAVPAVRTVKEETLPSGQRITELLALAPPTVESVIGGAGGRHLVDELLRGAGGTMPACEVCEVHAAMVAAHRGGDERRLRALFARVLPLLNMQAVFRMSLTKAALRRRGLIRCEAVRAAVPALDDRDRAELAFLLGDLSDLLIAPPACNGP